MLRASGRYYWNFPFGNVSLGDNDITQGYRYDTVTGVRTYRSYNVDGNANGFMAIAYHRDLWVKGLSGRINIQGNFNNYSNMIGENAEPAKQTVHMKGLGGYLSLYYAFKEIFSVGYSFDYSKSWSSANGTLAVGFNPEILVNGFSFYAAPFRNFLIKVNFDIHTRKGYIDSSLNDTRFLLNPGIEYKFRN